MGPREATVLARLLKDNTVLTELILKGVRVGSGAFQSAFLHILFDAAATTIDI